MHGGGVVRIDNEFEAGGDIRVQGPQGDDEVEGLELVDEGICLNEVVVVLLCVATLLGECSPSRQAQVTLDHPLAPDGRGKEVDTVPLLGIGAEPSDVLVGLGVDIGQAGPTVAPEAREKPAHESPHGRDAVRNVGEAA